MSELDPMGTPAAETTPPPPPPQAPPRQAPFQPANVEPRRKSRVGMFFFGAFSGCLLFFVGFFFLAILAAALGGGGGTDFSLSSDKVAILPIEGEILESRDTIEALHRYAENPMVRAIVVRINSPGGAIAPSQEIYSEIRRTRKKSGKPIIASLDSVAASGGYYIAVGCDSIVANPGSITGSIGVIMQWFELRELVQWAKVKPETLTSGAMKDAGSPFREMTEAERAYLQRIVGQLHLQFVKAVAAGRTGKLTEAEVAKLADGRVYTGEEAHALKLVDQLGSLDEAVDTAAKLAGIEGDPSRIYPKRREGSLLELLASDGGAEGLVETMLRRKLPRFLYEW
ncbi:MAG TPA: signal peptide peptidase SppA [Thermoanaerobaculia bacterium]